MTGFDLDWKPTSNKPQYDVGIAVVGMITNIVKSQRPEYLIYFPFQGPYQFEHYFKGHVALFRLTNLTGAGFPIIGELKDGSLIDAAREIVNRSKFPDFEVVFQELPEFFTDESFIYVGKQDDLNFSWEHLTRFVIAYLNKCVFPNVFELNRRRVLSAIPMPPAYDIQKIMGSLFVIETPSTARQGSCFELKGIGLVTCEHCIAADSFIYRASDINTKYPVKIISKNEVIDLAIFAVDGFDYQGGLEIGDSDQISLDDHVAVAGFPNHQFGDSGIFSPGLLASLVPD